MSGATGLDVVAAGIGLALAWSTENTGYSTLFVDNLGTGPAGGTIVFSGLPAHDARAKPDAARARQVSVPVEDHRLFRQKDRGASEVDEPCFVLGQRRVRTLALLTAERGDHGLQGVEP